VEKAFLTIKEVSQIINMGRTKTYELVRAGRLPKVVIEGCLRVPVAALRTWIAEQSSLNGVAGSGR
jgi:excisionase family DNA binding protein